MTPRLAQLQALALQIEAMRAQVEALVSAEIGERPPAPPVDSLETCPCGATGESQKTAPRTLGVTGTTVFCQQCKQTRVVAGP